MLKEILGFDSICRTCPTTRPKHLPAYNFRALIAAYILPRADYNENAGGWSCIQTRFSEKLVNTRSEILPKVKRFYCWCCFPFREMHGASLLSPKIVCSAAASAVNEWLSFNAEN